MYSLLGTAGFPPVLAEEEARRGLVGMSPVRRRTWTQIAREREMAAGKTGFPSLSQELHADVVIIGGGITGITAAMLLSQSGQQVVVLGRAAGALPTRGVAPAGLYIGRITSSERTTSHRVLLLR